MRPMDGAGVLPQPPLGETPGMKAYAAVRTRKRAIRPRAKHRFGKAGEVNERNLRNDK